MKMNLMKKMGSLFLAATLAVVFSFPVAAAAADDVKAKVKELEKKYGIEITYDLDEDGTPAIGTGGLATFDRALSTVTAPVVKQVSAHYQKTLGKKLRYSFIYSPYHEPDSNVEVLGSFDTETAIIEIYLPQTSKGTFMTGNSPITVVHEFAHAFYVMYADMHGEKGIERDWVEINGGVSYNAGYIASAYNKVTFMSGYGATSIREDFAEVFSHTFVRNKEGQGFYHRLSSNGKPTALGKKVSYIENMLKTTLTDTGTAVKNLNKIYETPVFTYYQGVKLGGEYTQFMGCTYPRYVLNGILNVSGIQADDSTWIKEVGGWYVTSSSGQYLVFPGGPLMELNKKLKVA